MLCLIFNDTIFPNLLPSSAGMRRILGLGPQRNTLILGSTSNLQYPARRQARSLAATDSISRAIGWKLEDKEMVRWREKEKKREEKHISLPGVYPHLDVPKVQFQHFNCLF